MGVRAIEAKRLAIGEEQFIIRCSEIRCIKELWLWCESANTGSQSIENTIEKGSSFWVINVQNDVVNAWRPRVIQEFTNIVPRRTNRDTVKESRLDRRV